MLTKTAFTILFALIVCTFSFSQQGTNKAAKRTACPHTRPPVGHAQSRSVSGTCRMRKCSP